MNAPKTLHILIPKERTYLLWIPRQLSKGTWGAVSSKNATVLSMICELLERRRVGF